MKEKEATTQFFEKMLNQLSASATIVCNSVRGCESVRQKAYRAANLNRDCGYKFSSAIDYNDKTIVITTIPR